MQTEQNLLLSDILSDDKLSVSEVSEIVIKMKRISDIRKQYGDKIKRRKDGKQYYIYIKRKQITSTTYEGLLDALFDYEYGFSNASIEDLYEKWLIWKRDTTSVTGKTLKEIHFLWNKFLVHEDIIKVPLCKLRAKDFVILFRKWTKDRALTRNTFCNIKSILNGIYAYAIENEIVENNPIKEINMRQFSYKPVKNDNKVFSLADRSIMLDYLKDVDEIYSLAIQLDFYMVCRIGELLALRWSDIQGDFIHIQSQYLYNQDMNDDLTFTERVYENVDHVKGNTQQGFRFMPLMPEAKEILKRIKALNPDGEYIFMHDNKQLNKDAFNRWLKKYCLLAGVNPQSSHKIRFTVASMLFDKGVPLATLQQLLGHTTTAMTLHYLRPITPLDETYSAMQKAFCS